MKFAHEALIGGLRHASRPARDAWVEIKELKKSKKNLSESRPARDAWVEIPHQGREDFCSRSRPARDAWVEIDDKALAARPVRVASRKGRVG